MKIMKRGNSSFVRVVRIDGEYFMMWKDLKHDDFNLIRSCKFVVPGKTTAWYMTIDENGKVVTKRTKASMKSSSLKGHQAEMMDQTQGKYQETCATQNTLAAN